MKVYLVRHGESVGNQNKFHQTPKTPLSEIGLSQAKLLAYRFKKIKTQKLFSSPMVRTMQTAKEISKVSKQKIYELDLLAELMRPSELHNLNYNDPQAVKIKKLVKENLNNHNWRYSDEEGLLEFKNRIKKLFKFLETQDLESVTLVTHGFVIMMILSLVMWEDEIPIEKVFLTARKIMLSNTGISVIAKKSTDWDKKAYWQIISINDDAHLG